jgi:hypothetical protein
MSEQVSWRWTLWIPAIASAILSILGVFFLPESYAPRVLQNKLRKLKMTTTTVELYTVLDLQERPTGLTALISDFIRPLAYLLLDPALLLASLFYSVIFGIIYLIIVTYADVFGTGYGHSVGIVGTDFLAAGIGMLLGTFATIKAMEAIFKRDSASGQMNYKPESRLISCAVGGTLLVGGLFMYGFTALRTHFIVVSRPPPPSSAQTNLLLAACWRAAYDGRRYEHHSRPAALRRRWLQVSCFRRRSYIIPSLFVCWRVPALRRKTFRAARAGLGCWFAGISSTRSWATAGWFGKQTHTRHPFILLTYIAAVRFRSQASFSRCSAYGALRELEDGDDVVFERPPSCFNNI